MRRSAIRAAALIGAISFTLSFCPDARAASSQRRSQKASQASKPKVTPTQRTPSKTSSKPASSPGRPRPKATPQPAKPDRSLFLSAQKAEAALRASSRLKSKRTEWEKAATAYLTVVDRYPRSPYCDDALLKAGDLQREASTRFRSAKYADEALDSYALIVEEYPGSRLGEPALLATYQILTARNQKAGAREAAEKYLAAYPDGKQARTLRQAVASPKTRTATRPAEKEITQALPSGGSQFERTGPASSGQVQVFGVRFWSGDSSTRVVIDLDRKVEIRQDRLQSPPRLFVDLLGTRLHPNLIGKTFPVGDRFLKQIRIGVNRENVVRVVIDVGEASRHSVFFLADPERLVIDVQGEAQKGVRSAGAAPKPTITPTAREVMENVQVTQPTPVLTEILPPPSESPSPDAAARSSPRPESAAAAMPPARPTPRPVPSGSVAPAKNRDGGYSLARQLGLGARRICLDAGHGGHDPGAIGRGGTQEKDITLAVVLKLEKLIRKELGADVVMTRDTDVFIPLEERTAIANASGADLFLSVHINSARNSAGRGIETYYLSFAKNAAAEEIAARENAISQATMKDLNNLVKAITTNSKIDESREFAGIIQRSHIDVVGPSFEGVLDRGVHTAPFYVLIGANMPSILTEVGFISNPEEERWLKSEEYQDKLALSLLEGVRSYLAQLNQSQASRLGGRPGVRVAARGRSQR